MIIEIKHSNPKYKAFVTVNLAYSGYLFMQYHAACGYLTSYIHEDEKGIRNEDGLFMPHYIETLVKIVKETIDSYGGN